MAAGRTGPGTNVNPDGDKKPEGPFTASTCVWMEREDESVGQTNVNSAGNEETEPPFAVSTGVRMERENGSAARPTESPMARDRTDPLAGPHRDGWRRVLALCRATVYHDGNVRMNHRPQGNRRPHGTAGRLLRATQDRNNPMHARRRRRPRQWLNHARRPRDRERYPV